MTPHSITLEATQAHAFPPAQKRVPVVHMALPTSSPTIPPPLPSAHDQPRTQQHIVKQLPALKAAQATSFILALPKLSNPPAQVVALAEKARNLLAERKRLAARLGQLPTYHRPTEPSGTSTKDNADHATSQDIPNPTSESDLSTQPLITKSVTIEYSSHTRTEMEWCSAPPLADAKSPQDAQDASGQMDWEPETAPHPEALERGGYTHQSTKRAKKGGIITPAMRMAARNAFPTSWEPTGRKTPLKTRVVGGERLEWHCYRISLGKYRCAYCEALRKEPRDMTCHMKQEHMDKVKRVYV